MQQQQRKIPALGRTAALGSLYSAHTESFYPGVNLFSEKITKDHYDEIEHPNTNVEFKLSNSTTDKLNSLNINGQVGLSVLAGMVDLSGSAAYLNSKRKNTTFSEMTLLYHKYTFNQEILSVKRMKINEEFMNSLDATHVVVGIDWGARCNITCQYENKTNKSDFEVNGMLKAECNKLSSAINLSGEAKANSKTEENGDSSTFNFTVECDVLEMKKIPQSFIEAAKLVEHLPESIKGVNEGRGIPLDYYLLPLECVVRAKRIELKSAIIVKEIEEGTIQRFYQLTNRFEDVRVKINTILGAIGENCEIFEDSLNQKAKILQDSLDVLRGKFQARFKKRLVEARKGNVSEVELNEVIDETTETISNQKRLPSIESECGDLFTEVTRALKIIESLKTQNIHFVGKTSTLDLTGTKTVLYLPEVIEQSKELTDNIVCFKRLVKQANENKNNEVEFIVLLTSFHTVKHPVPVIKSFKESRTTKEDVLKSEDILLKKCCVAVHSKDIKDPFKRIGFNPEKDVELRIRCPLSYTHDCSPLPVNWVHERCKGAVYYRVETKKLHCECGFYSPEAVNFRCDDPNHGQSYLTNQQTEEEIRQLKVKEVTNILVLGKTGVGKTTWINAIAKYLLYDTLKDAIDSKDYTACIPAKFSQTTEEGDTVTIAIGDWDKSPDELNERGELGKSSTKKPKSYYFDFDDKNQVRIIDTPGIVDTAGIEKDKENLELILDHISHFNNINGICILLPPNDSREGIEMRFCIGELLTHLHKSAAENIMFCFTKCHETFFKPGETLPVLKRFLANLKDVDIAATRNNCFYFENDSFRLLSCLQNGIEFNEKIIENYSPSWDHSATEAARLFKYVCKLKPHSTNETISLNKTRKWIVGMNKPMALIQANISNRIKLRNSKKQELTGIQEEVENLKDKLEFEFSMPFVIPLDHPKTVCHHESCTKKIKVGNEAKLEPIKSCHDPCDLSNVRADVMGESSLRGCKCMKNWRVFDGDECNVCHHSYEHHLHIRYNVGFKTEKATDKKVQEMLERNESQSKIIEEAIKNFERENKTDKEELNTILNISAQFACFLKRFAISTFNDGVYSYLELLIDEQKKLENNEKMNELIRMRDQYEIQKNIIEKAIKNSNGERSDKFISTPEEAEVLKEKLFLFEINGQLFKKMSEDIAKIELNFAFKESRVFLRKPVGKKFNGIFKTG